MHADLVFASAQGVQGLVSRVLRALDLQRVAAVALLTLLLSVRALPDPGLADFFSATEIVLAWLEHLLELALIALLLLIGFTVADEAMPRSMPMRLPILCTLLLSMSALLSVMLYAYYAGGFSHLPPVLRIFADALRWGLPAVFLALIGDVHRRALEADSAADKSELARAKLQQAQTEQQLALLQAQIEPHFLFNMLGNVRRLYRIRPHAAAAAVDSLMRYLRMALPQLRSRHATLGEERVVVQAYLDLFQLRMGARLGFSIEIDENLHDAEFPPMLLVTLVENAIKHGLEPAGGGRIEVRARGRRGQLEVSVLDDGVGFVATASSGTGVGLANIRRQLAARYQNQGRLSLASRDPRGAIATIAIPLRSAPATAHAVAVDGFAI